MPPPEQLNDGSYETSAWIGRALALFDRWKLGGAITLNLVFSKMRSRVAPLSGPAIYGEVMSLIQQARHDLLLDAGESRGAAIAAAKPHDFFDEVRKIVGLATTDLLIVDAYLNADFFSDYLAFAKPGVAVRLLAKQYVNQLIPAAKHYASQNGAKLEIRSSNKFHDRYIFIDSREGYHVSASLKDGGKNTPALIMPILDVFDASLKIYQDMWDTADVVVV